MINISSLFEEENEQTNHLFFYNYGDDGKLNSASDYFSRVYYNGQRRIESETLSTISNDGLITELEQTVEFYTEDILTSSHDSIVMYSYENNRVSHIDYVSDGNAGRGEISYINNKIDKVYHYDDNDNLSQTLSNFYDEHGRLTSSQFIFADETAPFIYSFYFYLFLNERHYTVSLDLYDDDDLRYGSFGRAYIYIYEYETAESCGAYASAEINSFSADIPTCKLDRKLPSSEPSDYDQFFF